MDLLTWVKAKQTGGVEKAIEQERLRLEAEIALVAELSNEQNKEEVHRMVKLLSSYNPDIAKQLEEALKSLRGQNITDIRKTEFENSLLADTTKSQPKNCYRCGAHRIEDLNEGMCDECYKEEEDNYREDWEEEDEWF